MRSWLLALAVMGCTPVATEVTEDTLTEAAPVVQTEDRPEPALLEEAGPGPSAVPLGRTEAMALEDAAEEVTLEAASLPPAVVAFIEARDTCEHLMGEFVGDPAIDEPRGINQQIEAACMGLDERLAALKAKHQHEAAIMAALSEYESLY